MKVGELIKVTKETILKGQYSFNITREFYYDSERVQKGYKLLEEYAARNLIKKIKEGKDIR